MAMTSGFAALAAAMVAAVAGLTQRRQTSRLIISDRWLPTSSPNTTMSTPQRAARRAISHWMRHILSIQAAAISSSVRKSISMFSSPRRYQAGSNTCTAK